MTQLMLELSQLEVEPVEVQEVGNTILLPEQNSDLETLTAADGENDVRAIITLAKLPVNFGDGGACCCTFFCCSNGACFCGE